MAAAQAQDPSHANPPLPPYEALTSELKSSAEYDRSSAMDLDYVVSPIASDSGALSTFSMDDLEVAKALTGLRECKSHPLPFVRHSVQPNTFSISSLLDRHRHVKDGPRSSKSGRSSTT